MSCAFVVAPLIPVVAANLAAIMGAVAGTAAAMGFAAAKKQAKDVSHESTKERVQIQIKNAEASKDVLVGTDEMQFHKDGMTLMFRRDGRGRCTVCAEGKEYTREALEATAKKFVDTIVQKYVYNRVVDELKSKGFDITAEEVTKQQSIRLVARKWK